MRHQVSLEGFVIDPPPSGVSTPPPAVRVIDVAAFDQRVAAPARADEAPAGPGRWWLTLLVFGAVAVVLWVVVWWTAAHLHRIGIVPRVTDVPGGPWFEGWGRWDAVWYRSIVENGYSYTPGVQSPVAFFPGYPALVWLVHGAFPSVLVAGSVVTLAAGATAVVLFRRWAGVFLARPGATTAVALVVLYPFGWYLFGAVYADAFFLAVAVGAFLALERDRLWLVALLGTIATVSRPTGTAVAIGLVLRLLELRNPDARRWRSRFDLRSLRSRDALILVPFTGIVGWMTYLGVRFGDPVAFSTVQAAPGWDQPDAPSTWLKFGFFRSIFAHPDDGYTRAIVAQAVLVVIALVLVVVVRRRLGWAYAGYCLAVLALPLIGSKDFMGMGRYLLPAFPVFAVAGALLAERPRLRLGVLATSGVALVVMAGLFGRGQYLS